jgi:hypothetical protein
MPMADEKLMVAMTPQDLLEMNIFQKKFHTFTPDS